MTAKLEEYVLARVDRTGDCWDWTGSMYSNGYGRVRCAPNSGALVHRVAYTLWVGPIPEGLTIDHLCRNRRCINPVHLEAVTLTENVRRTPKVQRQIKATHCPQGHPYDEANTYRYRNVRMCCACRREHNLVSNVRNIEQRRAAMRTRYYAKTGRSVPDTKRDCGPRWEGSESQAIARRLEAA